MIVESLRTLSPVDGRVYVERPMTPRAEVDAVVARAASAARSWRKVPLERRQQLVAALIDAVSARAPELATELTWQMGRPISQTPGEIKGFADRGHTMIRLATEGLADVVPPGKDGFKRFIRREPLGVVLVLSPWNYPWLCAVNAVVPALLAGNAVILKHSDQTPLVAERFVEAGLAAGLPEGLFQYVHLSHPATAALVQDPRIDYVAFTGSVEGGRAVHRAAADRFIHVGLELGGKDPAYVRADADLEWTADNLVDGAMFNSGQSCCAIERIYVHASVYDRFVARAVETTRAYLLDDPTKATTNLGPVVRSGAGDAIRAQVAAAVAAGARALIPDGLFRNDGCYVAPQILIDVDHRMDVMREETFGPVVGIMKVSSDEEAIRLMNDSRYGLTASIWTGDDDAAEAIGAELETGTVFLNRCDYLDPELAWVGVKDSGRGATLSTVGFEHLTRAKSFHLRHH
jgi:acyl-CoA reductase-like NAD-dependent aldehyde dehydrogenase